MNTNGDKHYCSYCNSSFYTTISKVFTGHIFLVCPFCNMEHYRYFEAGIAIDANFSKRFGTVNKKGNYEKGIKNYCPKCKKDIFYEIDLDFEGDIFLICPDCNQSAYHIFEKGKLIKYSMAEKFNIHKIKGNTNNIRCENER